MIKVGGATDVEVKEGKDRADDAQVAGQRHAPQIFFFSTAIARSRLTTSGLSFPAATNSSSTSS